MDSEIQEIITRFKLLKTSSARRAAYHRIIDELDSHDWRDVKKRINERSFQKDILGTLPLDIALQLIKCLDLSDVHSLRRVSKRWCEVLSSDLACSSLLCLYTGRPLDYPNDDAKSTLARYSKHRSRLEQGIPFQGFPFVMHLGEIYGSRKMDHCNGIFAWLSHSAIKVYNKRSQRMRTFYTENRERCKDIRITEKGGNVSIACSYTRELPLSRNLGMLDVEIHHDFQDGFNNKTGVLSSRLVSDRHALQDLLPVVYHPRAEDICIHKLPAEQTGRRLSFADVDNGILYWLKNDGGEKSIWISDPYAETPLYAARSMIFDQPRDPSDAADSAVDREILGFTGDCQFVSIFDAAWLQIWDFDDMSGIHI
ncbi:hypothetical protein BDV18DRAFT_162333 [Aspergillus unguis]